MSIIFALLIIKHVDSDASEAGDSDDAATHTVGRDHPWYPYRSKLVCAALHFNEPCLTFVEATSAGPP